MANDEHNDWDDHDLITRCRNEIDTFLAAYEKCIEKKTDSDICTCVNGINSTLEVAIKSCRIDGELNKYKKQYDDCKYGK